MSNEKKIALLGSTGSIGTSTLDVIRTLPGLFSIEVLAVNSNIDELEKQINEFRPAAVAVRDVQSARELKSRRSDIEILSGDEGLKKAASEYDYDIFVGAMVGFAGLAPTIEAIKRGRRIALANKETLVVAGELVMDLCSDSGAELLPVDSEHGAIFQCLMGENSSEVDKIILTASGGPFFKKSKEEFAAVTIDEALDHPTWKMGSKITIDSATMMNKGLEVIEAHWLFGKSADNIEVVIHPQSVIHSMVKFVDGSLKAQLSTPDMKLPIQFALTYPQRVAAEHTGTHFPTIGSLSFYEPDLEKFECLALAYDALDAGGTAPCILNASNEIAVNKFLNKEIKFSAIPEIIKRALDEVENHQSPDLEKIFECDKLTREIAAKMK